MLLPALAAVQLIALIRNIVLSRVLGPEQFGIAVTFILLQQFLEMSSEGGINKFVLQSKRVSSNMQGTLQLFSMSRGVAMALLLLMISFPVCHYSQIVDSVAPFVLLSLTCIASSLIHFDNFRLQRTNQFGGEIASNTSGEIAGFIASVITLYFTPTYIAILVGILFRSVGSTVASHLFSRRKYILKYKAHHRKQIAQFAAPLFFNGPVLFLSSQSDRVLIDGVLGHRALGVYSAAITLLFLPLGLITRMLSSIFIPSISKAFHDGDSQKQENEFYGIILVIYAVTTLGFCAVGSGAIEFLYGKQYAISPLAVAIISFIQGIRFLRSWPSGVSLSLGKTKSLFISNLLRLALIPASIFGYWYQNDITGLALGILVAEMLSFWIAHIALNISRSREVFCNIQLVLLAVFPVLTIVPLHILFEVNTFTNIAICGSEILVVLVMAHIFDAKLLPRNLRAFGW
jgi:O-antigen/teichoic acid export membrane protein